MHAGLTNTASALGWCTDTLVKALTAFCGELPVRFNAPRLRLYSDQRYNRLKITRVWEAACLFLFFLLQSLTAVLATK